MAIEKILVCADGEHHTRKAEEYALLLAKRFSADLVVLHVVDPFLKKFTDEIYAVNRDECRDHLDRSLRQEGRIALDAFSQRASHEGVTVETRMRHGEPQEEVLREINEGNYDLVIMGAKLLKGWKERFESFNLPAVIFRKSPVPVLFVR